MRFVFVLVKHGATCACPWTLDSRPPCSRSTPCMCCPPHPLVLMCHRYGMHSVVANLLSRLNDEVFVYTPPPSGSGPKPVVTLTPGAGAKPAGGTLEEVRAVDYHEAWVQCTSAWHCLPAPNHLHHHRQPCPLMSLCHLWMITVLWPCFVGVPMGRAGPYQPPGHQS